MLTWLSGRGRGYPPFRVVVACALWWRSRIIGSGIAVRIAISDVEVPRSLSDLAPTNS